MPYQSNGIRNCIILSPFQVARDGKSKNLHRQDESYCSDPEITYTTLLSQPLKKSNLKHKLNIISKKFSTTSSSIKSLPTLSKASSASAPVQLTTQDIINASLRKSTFQKYLSYQTRWKEYYAENNIIYYNPVEQFLNFFTELFNQGVSHSVLVSPKSSDRRS